MASGTAKGELKVSGKVMEKTFELIGRVARIRPGPAEMGSEPTEA